MKTALALEHLNVHHGNAEGWIALAQKQHDGRFKQFHYQVEDIAEIIEEWNGEDIYYSQNTFWNQYRGRIIENIKELRSLYVDVDCYKVGLEPQEVLRRLEREVFRRTVPEPNTVLYSGRGFVLQWYLEPEPYHSLPKWQLVEDYISKQFINTNIGVDSVATDAPRIFRLAGSINSKSKQMVLFEIRHDYRYTLDEIYENYIPEIVETKPKRQHSKSKAVARDKKANIGYIRTTYTLHYSRLMDLVKLAELRGYKAEHRRKMMFLYRYWSSLYLRDPVLALENTLDFNKRFIEPLSEKEVLNASMSAEKAWEKRQHLDESAIRNMIKAGANPYELGGYNFSNQTLIEMLEITSAEQEHLSTIIDSSEKQRRNTEYQKEKRRANGVVERSTYLASQQNKTQDKIIILQNALKCNPNASNRELARIMNVSEGYIRKLKKQLEI